MLTEVTNTRQHPGERFRRWFSCQELDLYIWQDENGAVVSFQLCYSKYRDERALCWKLRSGFAHLSVDDGETELSSCTPIFRPDGHFDRDKVLDRFRGLSVCLPREIVHFVVARLLEYPGDMSASLRDR